MVSLLSPCIIGRCRETAAVKKLTPPDSHHLRAAEGILFVVLIGGFTLKSLPPARATDANSIPPCGTPPRIGIRLRAPQAKRDLWAFAVATAWSLCPIALAARCSRTVETHKTRTEMRTRQASCKATGT